MGKPVKYARSSAFNMVTISLVAVVCAIAYLAFQYVPIAMLKSEASRTLEATATKFAGSRGRYVDNPDKRKALQSEMMTDLRRVGILDPKLETWIEMDSPVEVRFGAVYSVYVEWPFDVIPRQEKVVELEYLWKLPTGSGGP